MGALGSRYSEYEQAFAATLRGRPDRHIVGARVDVPGRCVYSVIAVKPAAGSRGLMVSADAAADRVIVPHFIYFTDNLGIYLGPAGPTRQTTVNDITTTAAPVVYSADIARPSSHLPNTYGYDISITTAADVSITDGPMCRRRSDNVAMPTVNDLQSELAGSDVGTVSTSLTDI